MGINAEYMGSAAKIMKASIFFLVLASASAAPQFEGLKNIFSALSGDDEPGEVNGDYEQVPYTTLKKFDGYEMRQYPSVKWVCTDVTYKMEKEDSLSRTTSSYNTYNRFRSQPLLRAKPMVELAPKRMGSTYFNTFMAVP